MKTERWLIEHKGMFIPIMVKHTVSYDEVPPDCLKDLSRESFSELGDWTLAMKEGEDYGIALRIGTKTGLTNSAGRPLTVQFYFGCPRVKPGRIITEEEIKSTYRVLEKIMLASNVEWLKKPEHENTELLSILAPLPDYMLAELKERLGQH
jgi:hypothetical protein